MMEKPSISLVDNEEPEEHNYDFDLIVIGGGSGGLAVGQESAKLGKKVAIVDFVSKSPYGSTWGLGGTCVNVGCIPKKLMHQGALLGSHIEDAIKYGWEIESKKHNWKKLVNAVQDYIKGLNFNYRVSLRENKITYINAYATFIDKHTIECKDKNNNVSRYSSRRFVIAVGMRPIYQKIPGIEYCISSDDIFSLKEPPGKTLVIGASYVGLECAGFLTGLGFDVSCMVRSIFLRGFDQEMANLVANYMEKNGTKFIRPAVASKIEKLENNKLKVEWIINEKEVQYDVFDTVLMGIGRKPETENLKLDTIGIKLISNAKIPVVNEQTVVPHIYALGDVTHPGKELTPSAIHCGLLLARRLYNKSKKLMDYNNIPTTVFTPLEYGCCGLSEEEAIEKYQKNNIEVYHLFFKPLEWTIAERENDACYLKLIANKLDNERIIGIHVVGPNAGEITQGFAVALTAGVTKQHFDDTTGIHPTIAEEFIGVSITKASGKEPRKKTSC